MTPQSHDDQDPVDPPVSQAAHGADPSHAAHGADPSQAAHSADPTHAGRRHRYQDPASTMTLREGLDEYFSSNPELVDPATMENPEAAALFSCHDAVHVVFGTNTDIKQEAMTDMWAIWGSDVGWRRYFGYLNQPEPKAVLKQIARDFGYWHVIRESFAAIPYVWRVRKHAKRMHQPWPFYAWEQHLDRRLCDIRRELGVELVEPPPVADMPSPV